MNHLELQHDDHHPASDRHLAGMSDHTTHDTVDVSCPLLDKLAPETRSIIYEYVLSFDTLIKHATNLQPFVQKLTGAECNLETGSTKLERKSASKTNRAEPESSPGTEPSDVDRSLRCVNTSILATSKLIYAEAIDVFCKNNTISVDAIFCENRVLTSPLATDLSLATQIVAEIDLLNGPHAAKDGNTGSAEMDALSIAIAGCFNIFPKLRSSHVSIYADALHLFDIAVLADTLPAPSEYKFDGVGSAVLSCSSNPDVKFIIQCKATMKPWEREIDNIAPGTLSLLTISASYLCAASRGDRLSTAAQYARLLFNATLSATVPEEYGTIDEDSPAFWTMIDTFLSAYQSAKAEQTS